MHDVATAVHALDVATVRDKKAPTAIARWQEPKAAGDAPDVREVGQLHIVGHVVTQDQATARRVEDGLLVKG